MANGADGWPVFDPKSGLEHGAPKVEIYPILAWCQTKFGQFLS
jgi:hypothetical protein